MKKYNHKIYIVSIVAFIALSACVPWVGSRTAVENGIGIGGTGALVAGEKSGIGIGGTGVMGTISGFGSVWVNGMRLLIDETEINQNDLAVGDVIIAYVNRKSDDQNLSQRPEDEKSWVAFEMQQFTPIAGRVEAVNVGEVIELTLMNTKVAVDIEVANKLLQEANLNSPEELVGKSLKVSGLWREDEVVASRIILTDEPRLASLSGTVKALPSGELAVGDTVVDLIANSSASDAVKEGSFIKLEGEFVSGKLRSNQFSSSESAFAKPVSNFVVEGYLKTSDDDEAVSGTGLSFAKTGASLTVDDGDGAAAKVKPEPKLIVATNQSTASDSKQNWQVETRDISSNLEQRVQRLSKFWEDRTTKSGIQLSGNAKIKSVEGVTKQDLKNSNKEKSLNSSKNSKSNAYSQSAKSNSASNSSSGNKSGNSSRSSQSSSKDSGSRSSGGSRDSGSKGGGGGNKGGGKK